MELMSGDSTANCTGRLEPRESSKEIGQDRAMEGLRHDGLAISHRGDDFIHRLAGIDGFYPEPREEIEG